MALSFIGGMRLFAAFRFSQKVCRNSRPIQDSRVIELSRSLVDRMCPSRNVRVRETDQISSAAVSGWLHPTILLPSDWRRWSLAELQSVLAHELAHVARHDSMWRAVSCVVTTTHYYNPLIHLLVRRIALTQEITADVMDHPDQLALLRREPERIPNAVEEFLRFDSPVQITSRLVKEDGELAGRPLRRGEQIILLLGAANRDPEVFPDPERLDVTRDNVRHLSFGHGIHFCLGAQLARLEGALAFRALIERFPRLELTTNRVEWRKNTVLRGPTALLLRQ